MTTRRTARAVPDNLNGCGWLKILPPESELDALPSPLETSIDAEIVILGAGFAGLSAARRILQIEPRTRLVVLEAGKLAWGSSGRNSGFMIDLPHDLQSEDYASGRAQALKEIKHNRAAIGFAKALAEEFSLGKSFDFCGKYHAAASSRSLKLLETFSLDLDHLQESFKTCSAQDMKDLTGSDYYLGGLFTPGCALIQPAAYIRGLGLGLAKKYQNFRLFQNSAAIEINSGSKTPAKTGVEIKTAKGGIHAEKVIVAMNGHLESFGWFPRQFMHVYTYASMTRELTPVEQKKLGGQSSWGLIPAHPMGTTVRRIRENRIIVRNTFTYNPDMLTDEKQIQRSGRKHDQSYSRRFPMLPSVEMEYRWGGHLCLSRNSTSVFGELEPNVYAAACHNGLGVSKGTLGGMLIADLVMSQPNPLVDELLLADKPTKLFPDPFMTWGARSYLEWIQWRAGKDL